MRVKAKRLKSDDKYAGYYNLVRRKPGDVFNLVNLLKCELKRDAKGEFVLVDTKKDKKTYRSLPECTVHTSTEYDNIPSLCLSKQFSMQWMEPVSNGTPLTNAPGEPTEEEVREMFKPKPLKEPRTFKEAQGQGGI